MSSHDRSLSIGVVASLVVHGLLASAMVISQRDAPSDDSSASDLIMVDIEEAPEAQKAHAPKADKKAEPDPTPDNGGTIAPPSVPPPGPDPAATSIAAVADAGVPDARTMVARKKPKKKRRPRADASVAIAIALGPVRDAGVGGDGGGGDAGPTAVAAASGDAGPEPSGPPPLPGANANLLSFMPRGEVVTVLIRWDRLRPTEWAKRTEAIMAPMPDYQMMMGKRRVRIAKNFDSMVIASPDPRAVNLTTVVAHTRRKSNAQVRAFLDHTAAPVAWSVARGGALGTRKPSALTHAGDKRVYLMPYRGWVVLSRPKNFGKLLEPGTGELDAAAAARADLPTWLARLRTIEAVSGRSKGASVIVTYSGFRKQQLDAPVLGTVPAPLRLTLALEVAKKGFYVRGEMIFRTAKNAEDFVAAVKRFQDTFVDSSLGKKILDRAKAYNAAKLLSVRQGGRKVGYSTSISIADGRNMMELAAQQTQHFYAKRRRRIERRGPAKKPGPKAPPAKTP